MSSKVQYQYPPRLVSSPGDDHGLPERIRIKLTWDDSEETEADPNETSEELLARLGGSLGHSEEYVQQCFVKTVGEDSFLCLQGVRLADYAFVRERVASERPPRLAVLHARAIVIEQAHETVYLSLQRDCDLRKRSDPDDLALSPRNASLTAISLSSLGLSISSYTMTPSSSGQVENEET